MQKTDITICTGCTVCCGCMDAEKQRMYRMYSMLWPHGSGEAVVEERSSLLSETQWHKKIASFLAMTNNPKHLIY